MTCTQQINNKPKIECIDKLVEGFILLNKAGCVLELCKKYYAKNVLMFNNGNIFATSREEAYDKQKVFVQSVAEHEVNLVSKKILYNVSELIFNYKLITYDTQIIVFTGKHTQHWHNNKITKEEYESIS